MRTTIIFVRHAHSTYTPDELGRPLSSKGFSDAVKMSEVLKNEPIDVVISSPYKRAVQTVEAIAEFIDQKVIIDKGFMERKLSDEPVEDFDFAIKKVWQNPSFSWNGGESNEIAQLRGVEATLKVLDLYEGNNILIGTHGNIMVLIMKYFDDHYDFSFWKNLEMPDAYRMVFENKKIIEVKRLLWKSDGGLLGKAQVHIGPKIPWR
ncbi:phosphoglycerate mutase family protein [Sporosarcina aquimarina]|uniref:histidine phosphatase family protein n=1 Tax=Sporosarcina aquimarina TaxID=114975 RepID=UPI0020411D49|nr:histidine phosphatase family protein [Sporosarcina aquimarina]MCM3757151.1 phosphoglycerate mutase family protein [Sporosarcina aquimarina]